MPFRQLIQSSATNSVKKKNARISDSTKRKIGDLFSRELSIKDISKEVGVHVSTVYAALKSDGVKLRVDNAPYEFSDLYQHIKSGGTIPSFAKSKNLTKSAVDYHLRKKYGTASISNFMRKHNER